MHYSSIPAHERNFQETGLDSSGRQFTLTPETVRIPGTTEQIQLIDTTYPGAENIYYYKEQTAKRKIVLHFTMGFLKGDIQTLTRQHVSVPFVIARSGKIYNLFASKYWSYHLGPTAVGGNEAMSKESIGIEISNIGPLKKIGDNLVSTYRDTDIYCTIQDTNQYYDLGTSYRGYRYFAKYTEAQYVSLIQLLKYLTRRYNIPAQFLPAAQRPNILTANAFAAFTGIVSHVNCRMDKRDIGNAFDWRRIINSL